MIARAIASKCFIFLTSRSTSKKTKKGGRGSRSPSLSMLLVHHLCIPSWYAVIGSANSTGVNVTLVQDFIQIWKECPHISLKSCNADLEQNQPRLPPAFRVGGQIHPRFVLPFQPLLQDLLRTVRRCGMIQILFSSHDPTSDNLYPCPFVRRSWGKRKSFHRLLGDYCIPSI